MRLTNKIICNLRCTISEPNLLNKANLYLVVLCHGYGAQGNDLVSIGEYLSQKHSSISEDICFIFPEGPLSLDNVGFSGARAWWEIEFPAMSGPIAGIHPRDLSKDIPEGMPLASNMLMDLVNQIMLDYGVSSNKIILGGFSQGSIITTDLALKMDQTPGGLIVMSGTLVCEDVWRKLARNRGVMKIFQSHGRSDPLLSFNAAERLKELFVDAGFDHKFLPFDGFHEIPKEILLQIFKFIKNIPIKI